VPLKLTAGALARALRILYAFFTVLDDAKHAIDWPNPYNTPPKIVTDGEKLQFMITEATQRKEHKPTIDEQDHLKLDRWWRPPQWDYTPTGRFQVHARVLRISRHQRLMGRRKTAQARYLPRRDSRRLPNDGRGH